jgi:hypothetical protein
MGGKDHDKDPVVVTEIKEIFCKMAAVAVEDEEAVTQPRFPLCKSIKDLFNPRQPNIIVRLPTWRCAKNICCFPGLTLCTQPLRRSRFPAQITAGFISLLSAHIHAKIVNYSQLPSCKPVVFFFS